MYGKPYRGFESLSLRQQVLTAEKFPRPFRLNARKMPIFGDNSSANRTAENGLLGRESRQCTAFLWRAHPQSGFEEGTRQIQFDQRPGIRPERVDFRPKLEIAFRVSGTMRESLEELTRTNSVSPDNPSLVLVARTPAEDSGLHPLQRHIGAGRKFRLLYPLPICAAAVHRTRSVGLHYRDQNRFQRFA
jgi:hypothetical protein